ncbi:hypothetical protein E1286_05245 [Nonomuraea terrae]|uniref:Uncharacterized protein n=1 Tax=Nonomuraea terrae TaxID=2530383 RepID=A0A4R4Z9D7_9ACTN|nr:hypothetical protein [Nonomuraea terrae]TDD54596.1 hypothetical protein E1286_05245 [Nonomuraea terrae]
MPIEIHSSSPAPATGSGTITTAAFSPPANSLLVAVVGASVSSPVISNSGTARTWTLRRQHASAAGVAIYTAPNPTALSNITVSIGTATGGLKVYVLTGQDPTNPIGVNGSGSSTQNNATVNGYVSTAVGSRGFAVAWDLSGNGLPTSTDEEAAWELFGLGGMGLAKASGVATAGETVTFNMDAGGTAAADWAWVALEIISASLDATIDAVEVEASAEVPAVAIESGQTVHSAAVEASAEVPAVELHAGQTADPDPVDAWAQVLEPDVVAGSAELVEPTVVDGAGDVPAPAITAEQHRTLTPDAVDASADVPDPDITAIRAWTLTPSTVEAQGLIPSPDVNVPVLPGDLITGDWQIEWAGQIYGGHGNVYRVLADSVEGWDNLPGLDSDSALRPSRHGAWPGKQLAQQREVSAIIAIDDPQTFAASLRALRRATRVQDGDGEQNLVIRTYGEALVTTGVVSAREIPTQHYGQGWAQVSVRWTCSDPRRYSLAQYSQVIPAGGTQSIANAGDVATSPRFRILGPAVNPVLVNVTLDRILGFDLTLTSGQLLEVNTQLGTVKIGETSYMSTLSAESVPVEDFIVDLDDNELAYEVDSGGAAGAECLWSDAYL